MGFLVNISIVHDWSSLIFGIIASIHGVLHLKWFGKKFIHIFRNTKKFKPKHFGRSKRRIYILILNLGLVVSSIILLTTGILKLPGVLAQLGLYPHYSLNVTLLHDWNGFIFGWLVITHFLLHWKWFNAVTRKVWTNLKYGKFIMTFSVLLVLAFPIIPMGINILSPEKPKTEGISIQLIGRFYFNPEDVETVRLEVVVGQ